MKNNVLITSAGRRVELVKSFSKELKNFFPSAVVFTADSNPNMSSACAYSGRSFQLPKVSDSTYIDSLLKICIENNIALVIPTIDTELLILSQSRDLFLEHGIYISISEPKLISECRDKLKTGILFDSIGIDYPRILNKNDLEFPCFVKPFDGSCSIGAFAAFSASDLTEQDLTNPRNMFMELIPKTFVEYTVDAYYSDNSQLICFVPRKRLETRAGEVSKGITKKNHVYNFLKTRLDNLKGARGCITVQLFVDEINFVYKGLEINPRFGGGFPLSYEAGANFPLYLIKEYILKENVEFFDNWKNNLLMLRYDASVLVENYES